MYLRVVTLLQGFTVFFEFRHYKDKGKCVSFPFATLLILCIKSRCCGRYMSTKCWSMLEEVCALLAAQGHDAFVV